MEETIRFTLNGEPVTLDVEANRPLLWVLRSDLGATGTKHGCNQGYCGACTVLVEGEAVRACRYPVRDVAGKTVTTIEGLAEGEELHPLQEAFMAHDALQCGFCTPGMILSAHHLLSTNPDPSDAEIVAALDHNFCRCGAHQRIIRAVHDAATAMRA